jgi:hypothetical protein
MYSYTDNWSGCSAGSWRQWLRIIFIEYTLGLSQIHCWVTKTSYVTSGNTAYEYSYAVFPLVSCHVRSEAIFLYMLYIGDPQPSFIWSHRKGQPKGLFLKDHWIWSKHKTSKGPYFSLRAEMMITDKLHWDLYLVFLLSCIEEIHKPVVILMVTNFTAWQF